MSNQTSLYSRVVRIHLRYLLVSPMVVLLVLLAGLSTTTLAQTTDGELWPGIEAEKKVVKDVDAGVAIQMRNGQYGTRVKSALGELSIAYKYNKYIQLKGNYRFSLRPDPGSYTSRRHRLNADVTFKYRDKPFTWSFRSRFQQEYDDLYQPENRQQPSQYYRFRPMLSYDLTKKNELSIGFEGYYPLDIASANLVDNTRYMLGYDRDLKKKKALSITYILERAVNVPNPATTHILRVQYAFKL